MIRRRMVGLLVGLLVVGVMLAPASASVTKTLGALFGGETLELGDKIFDNWSYNGAIGTGYVMDPDIAKVTLSTSGSDYCLDYQWDVGVEAGEIVDVLWSYDVRTLSGAPLIEDMSIALTGYGVSVTPARIQLSETLTELGTGNLLAAALVTENNPTYATSWNPPVAGVHVVKNLGMAGLGSTEAHVSNFQQCFSQVPEASSFALFGLGLAGLGLFRRFRKR